MLLVVYWTTINVTLFFLLCADFFSDRERYLFHWCLTILFFSLFDISNSIYPFVNGFALAVIGFQSFSINSNSLKLFFHFFSFLKSGFKTNQITFAFITFPNFLSEHPFFLHEHPFFLYGNYFSFRWQSKTPTIFR